MDLGSIGGLVAFIAFMAIAFYVARNPSKVKEKLNALFSGTSKSSDDSGTKGGGRIK